LIKNKYFNFALILLFLYTLNSCKITKIISKENVKPITEKKLYNNVINCYLQYSTLSLKYSADYDTSGKHTSFSGSIRIKKDRIIWISITPALGIELGRIQLTPDSIKFINRLNSEYFVSDFNYIMNKYQIDFDFYDIQAILSDEIFLYSEGELKTGNHTGNKPLDNEEIRKTFKSYTNSNLYVLQTERKRKIKKYLKKNKTNDFIVQLIYITNEFFKINKVAITDYSDKRNLNIEYSDFIDVNDKVFPTIIDLNYNNNNKSFNINLKYSKIVTGNDLSFPFTIPENYKKINL